MRKSPTSPPPGPSWLTDYQSVASGKPAACSVFDIHTGENMVTRLKSPHGADAPRLSHRPHPERAVHPRRRPDPDGRVPRPHGGRRTRPLIASRCFDTAWRFPGTDLDCLAIGNCFLRKAEQDRSLERERVDSFEPN